MEATIIEVVGATTTEATTMEVMGVTVATKTITTEVTTTITTVATTAITTESTTTITTMEATTTTIRTIYILCIRHFGNNQSKMKKVDTCSRYRSTKILIQSMNKLAQIYDYTTPLVK